SNFCAGTEPEEKIAMTKPSSFHCLSAGSTSGKRTALRDPSLYPSTQSTPCKAFQHAILESIADSSWINCNIASCDCWADSGNALLYGWNVGSSQFCCR